MSGPVAQVVQESSAAYSLGTWVGRTLLVLLVGLLVRKYVFGGAAIRLGRRRLVTEGSSSGRTRPWMSSSHAGTRDVLPARGRAGGHRRHRADAQGDPISPISPVGPVDPVGPVSSVVSVAPVAPVVAVESQPTRVGVPAPTWSGT